MVLGAIQYLFLTCDRRSDSYVCISENEGNSMRIVRTIFDKISLGLVFELPREVILKLN
jgi:hypothetical protein